MTLGPIEMMEAGITMTGPANQFGGKTLARTLASTMLYVRPSTPPPPFPVLPCHA